MITFAILRDLVRDLPGVEEGTAFGSPTLKAGKKALFFWNPTHNAPVFKVSFDERDFLIEADPDTFFTTDHHRPWPVVLARPDRVDMEWVRNTLVRTWRAQVAKKILRAWEAEHGTA